LVFGPLLARGSFHFEGPFSAFFSRGYHPSPFFDSPFVLSLALALALSRSLHRPSHLLTPISQPHEPLKNELSLSPSLSLDVPSYRPPPLAAFFFLLLLAPACLSCCLNCGFGGAFAATTASPSPTGAEAAAAFRLSLSDFSFLAAMPCCMRSYKRRACCLFVCLFICLFYKLILMGHVRVVD
jgi:hypothetical protein